MYGAVSDNSQLISPHNNIVYCDSDVVAIDLVNNLGLSLIPAT